jgi:hypothetical protein
MSHKELQEDLTHLRIRYGSTNVYKTLMKQMRDEYEELSSLFGVSSGNMPSSIFYPTNTTEFYKEYMEVAAQAAHDTLEEHPVFSSGFYDEDASIEAHSIHGDEFSLCPEENIDDMDLINQIFNNSCWPSATPLSGGSAESDISPETPRGESADTPQETLKIIQTCGASAASEEPHKKRSLKKDTSDTLEVIKETAPPAKPKKNSKKNQ